VGFSYCRARLSPKDDYPYMEIVECNETGKNTNY